jgi:hypothetical protein
MKDRLQNGSKKIIAATCALLMISMAGTAQSTGVSISATGTPPAPSSMLDVSSTNSGALIPRLTDAQRDGIQNPAEGLFIFNTTTKCFNVYKNAAWFEWCGTCISPPSPQAGANSPICQGGTISLTASTIAGAVFSWTGPNGFSSNEQNPVITNADISASGSYTVIATTAECAGVPSSVNVLVNPSPTASNAGSDQLNVMGTMATLSANTPSAGTGTWTIASGNGGNISDSTDPHSTFSGLTGETYVLNWTITNNCGSSSDAITVSFSAGGPKKVFMTSTTYHANLGGVSGAHSKCQTRAQAAGLSGTYKAWISTSAEFPANSFTQSSYPYYLVTGTQVAANWADLTDGSIDVVINRDEYGNVVPFNPGGGYPNCGSWLGGYFIMAWSATKSDGTFAPTIPGYPNCQTTCSDWTSTTGGGDIWIQWNNQNTANCGESLYRLMCFEQ